MIGSPKDFGEEGGEEGGNVVTTCGACVLDGLRVGASLDGLRVGA